MRTVFISYRRETAAGEARALFNDLVAQLGHNSVFMDVDSIALGRDFRGVLQETLASCDLMLVLIDRNWTDAKDERGRARLENPGDFVRLEIEAALKRDIVVTPVLVQGAHVPAAEQLPLEIRDLAYRNGFELSHNRWESDVREMVRRLALDVHDRGREVETGNSPPIAPAETIPKLVAVGQGKSKQWRVWFLVLALIILVSGGGVLVPRILLWQTNSSHENKELKDGYVALGEFNQQTKKFPNFHLVPNAPDDGGVKPGDIIKANTSVELRPNTENTKSNMNPSLGTIPKDGCVRILERLDHIREQTWAAVKQQNCS
jgi:hypothetical protein